MAYVQAGGIAEPNTEKHHIFTLLDRSHAVVGGYIQNDTKSDLKFHKKYEWSGRNQTPYPQSIGKTCAGLFVHTSGYCDSSDADIAAVVYAGSTNACGEINCAFLVAWSVHDQQITNRTPTRVYVEVGPIEKYIEIDWCKVKAKLDASRGTCYCADKTTGYEAIARISDGHHAAVVVSLSTIS